jgi:hypothetical protein
MIVQPCKAHGCAAQMLIMNPKMLRERSLPESLFFG